eukprot:g11138.t1
MALERKIDESALLIFQDSNGAERPECVMLDPGASAFLSGYGPFRRYLDHLTTLDFPIEVIKMSKGRRRFQFGGDASMWSDWSAHIPTFVDGKYGTIELFLLPGNTPMLCGRPIIEALGMTMDFAQRRLRIGSSPWMPATLGRQGEYLWSFTNEYLNINYDPERPEFVLRTNDQGIEQDDDYKLNDFMLAESGFTAFEKADLVDEGKTKPLRRHELKTMDVHLTTQLNDLSAYVTKELHQPERPRLLWEVYCGKARTAQVAESLGMEVRCFSYDTGWDFEQLKHQDEFLALLEEEAPDELLIAPECKLWSRTQCFACAKYKKPSQAAPAAMPTVLNFNDVLQADVMWLRRGTIKYAIMSLVDSATRYTAAVLINSEHTDNYIKALERAWIAHFGPPATLLTDEGRGWLSNQMDEWTAAHGIEHSVAPGEAHERLALVERRHAVIRKSVEVYLDDMSADGPSGIQEALSYIIPQMNSIPGVAGFSPSQWVLGY